VVSQEEQRRRVVAARTLLNIDQAKFNELGHEAGLGKVEAGRVERGEIKTITQLHRNVFAQVLKVPDWWFTAERDELIELLATRRAEEMLDRAATELHAARGLPPLPGGLGSFHQERDSDDARREPPQTQSEEDAR